SSARDAISRDQVMIGDSGVTALLQAPLWLSGRGGYSQLPATPDWATQAFANFRAQLHAENLDFDVWTRWYEARLAGGPVDLDEQRIRAGMEPEWLDKGAGAYNGELKRRLRAAGVYEAEASQPHGSSLHVSRKPAKDSTTPRKERLPKALAISKPPQTAIGQAVFANSQSIALGVAPIVALIDKEIAELEALRPNDPETIQKNNERIEDLRKLKDALVAQQKMAIDFRKGKIKEREVVKETNAFKSAIADWWKKDGNMICQSTACSAIFLGLAGVLSLMGVTVNGTVATVIAGVIAGGKPVADVVKTLKKGLFS
ncbi:MAG: hypothetical protein ACRC7C_04290, partial [Beijerinckiaceae bacterium]